jgi:CHAT domain-containing protein
MRKWLSLLSPAFVGIKKLAMPAIAAVGAYVVGYGALGVLLGHGPLASGLAIFAGIAAFWLWSSVTVSIPDDVILPPETSPRPGLSSRARRLIFLVSLAVPLIAWSRVGFASNAIPVIIIIGVGVFGALFGFGGVYRAIRSRRDRLSEALQALAKAETIRRQANRHREKGAIAEAIAGYKDVLSIRKRYRPKPHISVVEALSDLSDAHFRRKQFYEAKALAEELRPLLSLRDQSSVPVQLLTASNEQTLGLACIELKEYPAAMAHFANAMRVWNRLLQQCAGDQSVLEQVEAFFGDDEYPLFEDACRLTLALALGGYETDAIERDEQLVEIETGWIASRGFTESNLLAMAEDARLEALLYLYWQPVKAIRQEHRAFSLEFVAHGDASASAYLSLGVAWEELGAFAVARHHYDRSLELARGKGDEGTGDYVHALRRLGMLAFVLEDYPSSAHFYEEALTYSRRAGAEQPIGHDCNGLAKALLETGDLSRASGLAREALRFDSHEATRADAYSTLGEIHAREGSADAAIVLGKRAAGLVQSRFDEPAKNLLDVRHRKNAAPILRRLAGYLVDAGRLPEAQQVLDLLKEQEYDDFVTRGGVAGSVPEGPVSRQVGETSAEAAWLRQGDDLENVVSVLVAEQKRLLKRSKRTPAENARLEALPDLLEKARQEMDGWLDKLVDTLRRERAAAQAQVRGLNSKMLETLRGDLGKLGPGVALAHFVLGTQRLAIILTRSDLQISREVTVSHVEVHQLIHDLRREIRLNQGDRIGLEKPSRKLHEYLIAPIAEHLEDIETLMVVLHGPLRYLPLAALNDGSQYLLERCGVSLLTPASYTVLKDHPLDWASAGGVGGLGASTGADNAKPLAAVRNELRAIIREGQETEGVYPGKRYLDEVFTADALADALRVHTAIHIASHFEFSARSEAASKLLLGDGTELSLQQLRDDRFVFRDVELVTLSACETALGTETSEAVALQGLRRMSGVEFESLGTTIQNRGAKAVIATLWAVEDDSTAIIMKHFYSERRDGKTKAAALRNAQLALLRGDGLDQFTHPYFWAPFVLMGNWQ